MANVTRSPSKKILLAVGLLASSSFVAFVGVATYRLVYACDVTVSIGLADIDSRRREDEVLSDMAAVGIDRSSDPRVLFAEFSKRFSVIETSAERDHRRDIQSIAKTGGGKPAELVFVLVALFRLNGIDARSVEIYGSPEDAGDQDPAKVIRRLVFLPVLDRVFDPALPPADQHSGSGKALIDGTSRVHDEEIVVTTYQCPKSIVRSSVASWIRTRSHE